MKHLIVGLALGLVAGWGGASISQATPVSSAYSQQCWDRAESLNRHAQGLYIEYSGYVVSGWSADRGAIDTLNQDIVDYNNEVSAYNAQCDKQALKINTL